LPGANFNIADRQGNELVIGEALLALNDTYVVPIGDTITTTAADGVVANDIDPVALNPIQVTIVDQPMHGAVTLNSDGSFSYTQTAHAHDTFRYLAVNSAGDSSMAVVTITVPDIPRLPEGATLTTEASGLQVFDFEIGTGATPTASDTVSVGYTGYLPDGSIFDSREEIDFGLAGLIVGFAEGVAGMQVGGRRRIAIPPDLGYGSGGNPAAGIGGTDIIIFDIELLAIR
jgi:hypothetical protein